MSIKKTIAFFTFLSCLQAMAGFTDHTGLRWEIAPNSAATNPSSFRYLDVEQSCTQMKVEGQPGRLPTFAEAEEFIKNKWKMSEAQKADYCATAAYVTNACHWDFAVPTASEGTSATMVYLGRGSTLGARSVEKSKFFTQIALCVGDKSTEKPPVAVQAPPASPTPIAPLQLRADSSPQAVRTISPPVLPPPESDSKELKIRPEISPRNKPLYTFSATHNFHNENLAPNESEARQAANNNRARVEPLLFPGKTEMKVQHEESMSCEDWSTKKAFNNLQGKNSWICSFKVNYLVTSPFKPGKNVKYTSTQPETAVSSKRRGDLQK